MNNRYPIDEKYIRKFSNDDDAWIRKTWTSLHGGHAVIVANGIRGSRLMPYTKWKLKPNGDGTFSAYRLL